MYKIYGFAIFVFAKFLTTDPVIADKPEKNALVMPDMNDAYIYSIFSKSSLLDGGAIVHLSQIADMIGIGNRTENRESIKQSLSNLESNLGFEYYTDFQFLISHNLFELKATQYFSAKVEPVIENFIKMS